jgi:uncharacterized protein with HEPN domain
MQRDPRAFLWDVRDAALAIQGFVAGMDAAAYEANAMAQAAVERKSWHFATSSSMATPR